MPTANFPSQLAEGHRTFPYFSAFPSPNAREDVDDAVYLSYYNHHSSLNDLHGEGGVCAFLFGFVSR